MKNWNCQRAIQATKLVFALVHASHDQSKPYGSRNHRERRTASFPAKMCSRLARVLAKCVQIGAVKYEQKQPRPHPASLKGVKTAETKLDDQGHTHSH